MEEDTARSRRVHTSQQVITLLSWAYIFTNWTPNPQLTAYLVMWELVQPVASWKLLKYSAGLETQTKPGVPHVV